MNDPDFVKDNREGFDLPAEYSSGMRAADLRQAASNERNVALGWHVISGEQLLEMLRRVRSGEDPDMVYAEEWANADHERIEGEHDG